jgi:SAM-dependent methyltransferase
MKIKEIMRSFRNLIVFRKHFSSVASRLSDGRFTCEWKDRWPCFGEVTKNTSFNAHYLYHPAWAARIISSTSPAKHVDIGSSLSFITLLSAFVPIEFYDYRPASITLSGLKCGKADLLCLPFPNNSILSLSCMHVVEHIGLERYGDSFDPRGDLKAIAELKRVLSPEGHLFFVVPIGENARIQYNAHRIYTYEQIIEYFSKLDLLSFAFITDKGKFIEKAQSDDTKNNKYGCGCFMFIKH